MHCSYLLVLSLQTINRILARRQNAVVSAFAQLLIVMTSLLMSSSLFVASSSRHADVMVAESRFLSIRNADVIVSTRSFFQ
ncbi:hypothetical protein F511_29678 [Dorcoceras hygrometricum]|uniref:Uncharacterized protein n=1 Tax=Dorcoceras hygrometricum TaxID=472368 RepID=A0A2Z7DAZ0_9LAMI|nr:hypothetical protein F511_29678 [Dorcoceras hygrometricum]